MSTIHLERFFTGYLDVNKYILNMKKHQFELLLWRNSKFINFNTSLIFQLKFSPNQQITDLPVLKLLSIFLSTEKCFQLWLELWRNCFLYWQKLHLQITSVCFSFLCPQRAAACRLLSLVGIRSHIAPLRAICSSC